MYSLPVFSASSEIFSSGCIVFLRSDANDVCMGKFAGNSAPMASVGCGQAGAQQDAGIAASAGTTTGTGSVWEKFVAEPIH